MRRLLSSLFADERGASAVEYGLIAALIALTAIAGMMQLRERVIILYNNVSTNVSRTM